MTLMHREGVAVIGSCERLLPRVLFDTGALSSSYVSSQWVDENFDLLQNLLVPVTSRVSLADNVTVVPINHVINLTLSFVDCELVKHSATLRCCVLPMPETSLIVGLPHILFEFFNLFESMLRSAHGAVIAGKTSPHSGLSVLQDPWSTVPDPDSAEEVQSYTPCSFTGPLVFLLAGYENSLDSFQEMLSSHVSEEMKNLMPSVFDLIVEYKDVFVPPEWLGITGVAPLKLQFREGLPRVHKPPARPINPRLLEDCKKEFERMSNYFYRQTTSPHASPLVTAPKATAPFVRFCGDYRWINEYIITGHYPIPNVQHSLNKAKGFRVFCDLDMTNSFHQISLDDETGDKLSVQTPWGQVAPMFLPEGVGPASGVLQSIVFDLFSDFSEWTIAIFDNLLVLAHDFEDAYSKLKIILQRCAERRVVLKMAKSWIGVRQVTFFGYELTYGKYELGEARKNGITAMQFPTNLKKMQRFLGSALFFKSFIPDYSDHCALLTEMTKKDFDWNPATWKRDYVAIFEKFKVTLINSTAVFFPDYALEWLLRTDASDLAVGAVLVQLLVMPDSSVVHQPIGFASHKFTEQALKWDPYKKEGYGCYFGIKSFEYLLRGKYFVLETDHRNLLWIEASAACIVIRWRAFMQSFNFQLRHIAGSKNLVADWQSRMYMFAEDSLSSFGVSQIKVEDSLSMLLSCMVDIKCASTPAVQHSLSLASDISSPTPELVVDRSPSAIKTLLTKVHGGRNLHFGALRTWNILNTMFPGHRIPYRIVQEFVAECVVCQKFRLGVANNLVPVRRTLKQPYLRKRVGCDRVAVTPTDKEGYNNIIVVVAHWSKHVALYPAKDYEAQSMVTALFCYFTTYGTFDEIVTDPGSDFMSKVAVELNS